MKDFIDKLNATGITVVILGILINLLSAPIQRYLGSQTSNAFSWWKKRLERRSDEFSNEISRVIDRPDKKHNLQFEEMRSRINCVIFLAASLLFLIFDIITIINLKDNENITIYTSFSQIILILLSIIFISRSYFEFNKATHKNE